MEEYVPIITPKIIAKENPLKISPPKIKIENKASKVVIEQNLSTKVNQSTLYLLKHANI